MSAGPASHSAATAQTEQVCLRLAFEAHSRPLAAALAEQLELLTGVVAKVDCLEALSAEANGRGSSPTWCVELTTPPLALEVDAIHMWERRMLTLEGRWPGCRFLGWTTRELPALSRRTRTLAADRSTDDQARSQRELVEASLLRRPPTAPPSRRSRRSEIRPVR